MLFLPDPETKRLLKQKTEQKVTSSWRFSKSHIFLHEITASTLIFFNKFFELNNHLLKGMPFYFVI